MRGLFHGVYMIRDSQRICDCCEEEIAKGTKYKKAHLSRTQLAILQSSDDPEIQFTWTEHPDGTITIDLCLECVINMGSVPTREEMN